MLLQILDLLSAIMLRKRINVLTQKQCWFLMLRISGVELS